MNRVYPIQQFLRQLPQALFVTALRLGSRIKLVSLLLTTTLFCTVLLFAQRMPAQQSLSQMMPEQARRADAFVDFMGVAVHLNYIDTVYYQKYTNIIKPRLKELGIRHLRDGTRLPETQIQNRFKELAKLGIKTNLVLDPRDVNSSPAEAVAVAKTIGSALESVEGPNEWDLHPDLRYKGHGFPEGVRIYQSELYAAIKADPATANIPVLTPSMASPEKAQELGPVACDRANLHHYPDGETRVPTANLDDRLFPAARAICKSKAIVFTESGYHNAIRNGGVSEQASGKYLPRMLLNYFNRGVHRAYIYELIDLRSEPDMRDDALHYGLLRNDGSKKPAFNVLKNLIDLLKDPQANPRQPSSLTYSLTGSTANIQHTLLQKQNGTFFLILWQESPSFNVVSNTAISVRNRPLTLNLAKQFARVTVYQPLQSLRPMIERQRVSRLNLQVPDHPLVIKLES